MRASLVENARRVKNEIVKPLYKNLLKNGWTLNEIDEMDIHFYLDLHGEEEIYIDEANVL